MKDILLTLDGDLSVSERGDIALTDGVRQSVRIRLQWFLGEWRFARCGDGCADESGGS